VPLLQPAKFEMLAFQISFQSHSSSFGSPVLDFRLSRRDFFKSKREMNFNESADDWIESKGKRWKKGGGAVFKREGEARSRNTKTTKKKNGMRKDALLSLSLSLRACACVFE